MPTNQDRKLVERRVIDQFTAYFFDTGALQLVHSDSNRRVFSLTNSSVVEKSVVELILDLFSSQETLRLQSSFKYGVMLELTPRTAEGVTHIVRSNLRPESKLAYLVSYLHNNAKLSTETLEVVMASRPHPLSELVSMARYNSRSAEADFIRNTIAPNFREIPLPRLDDADYRSYCRRYGFVHSPDAMTYEEYMARHEENFFAPGFPSMHYTDDSIYLATSEKQVLDLYPREYQRYMKYFARGVPRELRPWARGRLDAGVETVQEHRDRYDLARNHSLLDWNRVVNYLTLDEAKKFEAYLTKPQSVRTIYRGVSEKAAAFVAFFWTVGGASKLDELIRHVVAAEKASNSQLSSRFSMQEFTLDWDNPFVASVKNGRLNILPYVRAITDPELRDYPLEWALSAI